jgi:preprotein translocase subunit SecG
LIVVADVVGVAVVGLILLLPTTMVMMMNIIGVGVTNPYGAGGVRPGFVRFSFLFVFMFFLFVFAGFGFRMLIAAASSRSLICEA